MSCFTGIKDKNLVSHLLNRTGLEEKESYSADEIKTLTEAADNILNEDLDLLNDTYADFGIKGYEKKIAPQPSTVREQTIKSFGERIKAGEKMESPEDLQFYENNKKEIEDYLQRQPTKEQPTEQKPEQPELPKVRVTAEQLEERQPANIRQQYLDMFNAVESSAFDWRMTSGLKGEERIKAIKDIKTGKNTAAARKLNQEIDDAINKGTITINRGRGNQAETIELPIDEWLKFTPIEQNKAIKAAEDIENVSDNILSIIKDNDITLQNIDDLKQLFDGFPYDQTDFEAVKTHLQREATRPTEATRISQQGQKEITGETIPPTPEGIKPIPPSQETPAEAVPIEAGKEAAPPKPPVEPPKEPVVEKGAEEELPQRRFTKRMLEDEELIEDVKESVAENLNYVRQTRKMSLQEANEIIEKVGIDEADSFVMSERDVKGAVKVILGKALIKKYNDLSKKADNEPERLHYLDKTIRIANFVTEELGTESGQTVEAFKLWEEISPEGQVRAAQKDMAKQAKEKMNRRKKDVDVIADKFKKANEETVEEVVKDKGVQEESKKDDNEKIAKAKDRITKAREKRANIIKKYKGGKGKNLFSSPLGLTPEGIEFVGDIAKTYIEEGVANLEILVQKILIHLEDAAGKKTNDEIKKQVIDISDKEFGKADKSFLGKALKDKNIQIGKIVKKHYTVIGEAKKNLAQKFMDEAGMEQSNAKELAKKVEAAFDRIATRKKRNILYHEKARFDKIQKAFQTDKKAESKTIQSEIIKYSNLGAFENQDMLNMLADKFGLKNLTSEQAAKLMELAEKVQKAPEGSPKNSATEDLLAYRATIKGNDWMETAQAVWYSNILSGYRTHEKNLTSTFFNSWAELGAEMLKDPKAIPYIIGGYIKGASKRGLVEAGHTLATGRSPIHIRKIETPTTLERKKFIGGGFNPANWFKYVTRLMVAEDVISFQGLKEARAYQLARREAAKAGVNTWTRKGWDLVNEKLFHTRERWLIAQDQAETEGLKPKTLEWRRRIYELMENSRPLEVTEDAYSFAANGTFNYASTGTLGAVTNAVSQALDVNVGGLKPLRLIVPFTRIITNVVNNSLDFTPVGLIRAARGVRGFRTFEESTYTKGAFKELTREERQRLVAKAAIGISMAAIIQALHVAGVITLSGGGDDDKKRKQQMREQGWEEYSIKIGGKWYSYKYTPLVFILGFLGNMNDAAESDDEATLTKRMEIAALRMGNQVADMTWINSAGTFLGALAEGTPAEQGKNVSNALSGMARGAIPFSQAITQTTQAYESIFNIPGKQVNNAWQALIQDIPIARNSLNDKINALGEPVKKDIDVLWSKENPDPMWKFIAEKKGWVATLSKNSIFVFDQNTKQDRKITDDEFYELAKLRGQLIRKSIQDIINFGYPIIRNGSVQTVLGNDMTSKEFNEVLSLKEAEATSEAKEKLFIKKEISEEEKVLKQELKEERNLLKEEE